MVTSIIPGVQLPVGAVPNPQAGTSKDTLELIKKSVQDPKLATGSQLNPIMQTSNTPEYMSNLGVSTTAPTTTIPTSSATQANCY